MSAAELSKTGKDLANAIIAQRNASNELNKSLDESKTSLNSANKNIKEFKNEVSGATTSIKGFYLDLGAMAARMATVFTVGRHGGNTGVCSTGGGVAKAFRGGRANGGKMSETSRWIQFFIASVRLVGEIVASEQQ
ncbi:MAG: hypothetical protein DBX55_03715 [Verrucomicrobia bacterium]|nr:MAG: hypothetical protein DBX55_03715 [Verrucomicrobiota bacterium]